MSKHANKALLDTNILLDAAMRERPGWAAAQLLLDEVAFGKLEAFVTATSLKDVYYVLGKYRDPSFAEEYIAAALDAFSLVAVDEFMCRTALRSDEPDFEDGIIRACAESAQVDFIVSRDTTAFKTAKIRRLTAQEYVDAFCSVEEVLLESDKA